MATQVRTENHFKQIAAKMAKSAETALADVGTEIVREARNRVRKRSKRLMQAIKVQAPPARDASGMLFILVGVDKDAKGDVRYAAIQEKGSQKGRKYSFTPYLLPSARIHTRTLGAKVKIEMQK